MRSTLQLHGECSMSMSDLPNDVLVSIISRLTLREATATSLLSRRWRYLHTYVTRLDFPSFTPVLLDRSEATVKSEERRFREHVKMIDSVMDSHRGGRGLKELKMHMFNIEGANFNKWMEFALTKDIETIDIAMHWLPPDWPESTPRAHYIYSLGLPRFITSSSSSPALRCLKHLTLTRVYMDEHDLELLISKFVNLETLRGEFWLKRLSIVGHPKLRHVEIRGCVKSIEIRDLVNLVALGFHFSPLCVLEDLHNVPNLTQLHTTEEGGFNRGHTYIFSRIPSSIRCQLQSLHVLSPGFCLPGNLQLDYEFVNVKHLEVEVSRMRKQAAGIFQLYHLIRACPSVEKLKIKFEWWWYELEKFERRRVRRMEDKYDKKLFPNLKVVEIEGYAGCRSEFKLASYIINHAENLEKLIVVACDETDTIRKDSIARAQEDFGRITPPSPGLQIIIY